MKKTQIAIGWLAGLWILAFLCCSGAATADLEKILDLGDGKAVYCCYGSCCVYAIADGESAIVIDAGDGSAEKVLKDPGVKTIDWVLFTHHHREQTWGWQWLSAAGAKIAAPEAERDLFEKPMDFRKIMPSLNDRFSVYGASFVRPWIKPIPLDRTLKPGDVFEWHGLQLRCIDSRGHSPGALSYALQAGDRRIVFSGDTMRDGSQLVTWFDSEWDYGYGEGLKALIESVGRLIENNPTILLPSHGPVIDKDPLGQLTTYKERLQRLLKIYVRGYGLGTTAPDEQDLVSKPTAVQDIGQVLPHLYKFKKRDDWPNFGILIADSGRALVFDAGVGKERLEKTLGQMKEKLGLKAIDAVLVTHMHGDHVTDALYLRDTWGAKLWTLDRIAKVCANPQDYDYAAMVCAYGGIDKVPFDRSFADGESFEWEGYKFTVDWMPGQTEFGCCIQGKIDGKLVAFTGDNLFGNPADPAQNGHEAVVARNSAIFEEGYILGADYLKKINPDIIVAGHSWVMDKPAGMIDRFAAWAREIRDLYQQLSGDEDYRYRYDPYWVRAEPYRVKLESGKTVTADLIVRNFENKQTDYEITILSRDYRMVKPSIVRLKVAPESIVRTPITLTAPQPLKEPQIICFSIKRDGQPLTPLFDMIVYPAENSK
jgi:glyoxylase-like metal-dependent hydrolase (beta-lactamase superfamily II)